VYENIEIFGPPLASDKICLWTPFTTSSNVLYGTC